MQQYLRLIGRECFVVNLDPANEYYGHLSRQTAENNKGNSSKEEKSDAILPYETIFDVCEDMISLSSVVEKLELGPNGGLLYCMEYIEKHIDHLISTLDERIRQRTHDQSPYLLFDFPGQAELYTHCTCIKSLLESLTRSPSMNCRLCGVQLIDSHFCTDPSKFISAALLSTSTMIRLELPMVNVLSKIDLLPQISQSLPFALDFFTDIEDLSRLTDYLDFGSGTGVEDGDYDVDYASDEEYQKIRQKIKTSYFYKKHHKMHQNLCEVVEDFGLLGYIPLDIQNAESVGKVLSQIDKCNGYVFKAQFSHLDGDFKKVNELFKCAMQNDNGEWSFEKLAPIQEKFTNMFQETIPELSEDKTVKPAVGCDEAK